jgi:alcohol dehydrogenase
MAYAEYLVGMAFNNASLSYARLGRDVGISANLAELGVKRADLENMAGNAKKDACQLTNPRTASLAQVVAIYQAALTA